MREADQSGQTGLSHQVAPDRSLTQPQLYSPARMPAVCVTGRVSVATAGNCHSLAEHSWQTLEPACIMQCLKNMIPVEQSTLAVKNRTRSHNNSYINREAGGGTKLNNTPRGLPNTCPSHSEPTLSGNCQHAEASSALKSNGRKKHLN